MATVNRAAAFVLALLLLVGGLGLIVAVFWLPGPYSVTASDGQQFSFSPLAVGDKVLGAVIGAALALAGGFLLALEFLGPPLREHLPVATAPATAGAATIARDSVQQRLAAVLEGIPGVEQAAPRVRRERGGTAVEARLTADPDAPVPPLCDQALAAIEQTLSQDLGLAPGPVRVDVRLARRRGKGAGKDSAAAAV